MATHTEQFAKDQGPSIVFVERYSTYFDISTEISISVHLNQGGGALDG